MRPDKLTTQLTPLFKNIELIINKARFDAAATVGQILLERNWQIGASINVHILNEEKPEYGESIISSLSIKLGAQFGRGYSKSNLFNMVKFARLFPVDKFQTLSGKLTWSHIVELLAIEDEVKRNFYVEMCRLEQWDTRTLKKKIGLLTFERTAIAKKPTDVIQYEIEQVRQSNTLSPDLVFRDPYILDFLDLQPPYQEKDIESAIIRELENFLLELGSDFTFIARQKRITIDAEHYWADLVMYHRRLRSVVVFEIKNGTFNARDKGQLELYLRWYEKHETLEGENPPIGVVLCTDKSEAHIELLQLNKSNIRVAQIITTIPNKEQLEQRLKLIIEKARANASAQQLGTKK